MKITRRQLRQLIRESFSTVNESSKEYTETMFPDIDLRSELNRINKKLIELEQAIDFMGGAVVSFKNKVKDISVVDDYAKALAKAAGKVSGVAREKVQAASRHRGDK